MYTITLRKTEKYSRTISDAGSTSGIRTEEAERETTLLEVKVENLEHCVTLLKTYADGKSEAGK